MLAGGIVSVAREPRTVMSVGCKSRRFTQPLIRCYFGGAENAGRENDGREIDGPICRA